MAVLGDRRSKKSTLRAHQMAIRAIVARFLHAESSPNGAQDLLSTDPEGRLGCGCVSAGPESRWEKCQRWTRKSRGGHPSCDGTADYLLRDCGSLGHSPGQQEFRRSRRGRDELHAEVDFPTTSRPRGLWASMCHPVSLEQGRVSTRHRYHEPQPSLDDSRCVW